MFNRKAKEIRQLRNGMEMARAEIRIYADMATTEASRRKKVESAAEEIRRDFRCARLGSAPTRAMLKEAEKKLGAVLRP